MKRVIELENREEYPSYIKDLLNFWLFWFIVGLIFLIPLPAVAWKIKLSGTLPIAIVGIWRYTWFFINYFQSLIYKKRVFPKIRKKASKLKNPYPLRLYFLIPSYKEEKNTTRKVFSSLVREVYKIPSEIYAYVSVGSEEEAIYIKSIVKSLDYKNKINITFLIQSHGKRIAMGHALRAIARHFNHPLYWHSNYKEDLIIFMDGDTILGKNILVKSLPFFKLDPTIGAITTDEDVIYLGNNKIVGIWYHLKFAKRHIMMMSHSLHKKVLTLTGRFSIYRADIVLCEDFIRLVESDYLIHYLYGSFRFLMGDDKSTWFYLLKNRWNMLYIPDVIAWSAESRGGKFFKVATSLMKRWYGNMLRNNLRALKLGPSIIGSKFIWFAILDQRISMWTSLIGPIAILWLSVWISYYYFIFYLVWVIITRGLLITFVYLLAKFKVNILHLPLTLFDQWIGSILKIQSNFNLSKQKWQKGAIQSSEEKVYTYRNFRKVFRVILKIIYIIIFLGLIGFYVKILKI